MCVLTCRKWSYAISGNMVQRKTKINLFYTSLITLLNSRFIYPVMRQTNLFFSSPACMATDSNWTSHDRPSGYSCQIFGHIRGPQWDIQTYTSLRSTNSWRRRYSHRCVCWAVLCRNGDNCWRWRNKTGIETWRSNSSFCVGAAEHLYHGACGQR